MSRRRQTLRENQEELQKKKDYSFKSGMKECPACGLRVKRGLHIHIKYCDEINNI